MVTEQIPAGSGIEPVQVILAGPSWLVRTALRGVLERGG